VAYARSHVATISPHTSQLASPDTYEGSSVAVEVCTVVRWRGYVSSAFYAARSPDRATIAASETFRWRGPAAPPDSGASRAAYDALRAQLLTFGWHDAGRTGAWFEHRFERRVAYPVAPVAPPPPAPGVALEATPTAPFSVAAPVRAPAPPAEDENRAARTEEAAPVETITPSSEASRSDRSRSRTWTVLIATLMVLVLAVAGAGAALETGLVARHASRHPATARPIPAPATSAPLVATPAETPAAAATPVAPLGQLSVVSIGAGSWLEVRSGSAHGRVLFAGVITHGKHKRFQAHRLWVMFGAATNLVIRVNGERKPLQGTVEGLVTSHGLTAP
jgi:Domain of unknown function (DUF4115)